jgi:antitoxin (DNA-binding transcriptional repressor) of toxin-antitoxin stability system
MQDLSVNDAAMTDLMAMVAKGETVRLMESGKEVALVFPKERQRKPAPPFAEWVTELRGKYDWNANGLTKEEVDSWRDKSPGGEPLF